MADGSEAEFDIARVCATQKEVAQRLRRLCLSYATSQETMAAAFERIADAGGANAETYRLQAKWSREAATASRIYLDTIDRSVAHQHDQ